MTVPMDLNQWRMGLQPDEREAAEFVATLPPYQAQQYLAVEIIRTHRSQRATIATMFAGSAFGHGAYLIGQPIVEPVLHRVGLFFAFLLGGS